MTFLIGEHPLVRTHVSYGRWLPMSGYMESRWSIITLGGKKSLSWLVGLLSRSVPNIKKRILPNLSKIVEG